jgi:hypothetical protein
MKCGDLPPSLFRFCACCPSTENPYGYPLGSTRMMVAAPAFKAAYARQPGYFCSGAGPKPSPRGNVSARPGGLMGELGLFNPTIWFSVFYVRGNPRRTGPSSWDARGRPASCAGRFGSEQRMPPYGARDGKEYQRPPQWRKDPFP